jgi:hypothetical protein
MTLLLVLGGTLMLWMNTTLRWFTAAAAHALFTLVLLCRFVPRTGMGVCSVAVQETETVVGAVSLVMPRVYSQSWIQRYPHTTIISI